MPTLRHIIIYLALAGAAAYYVVPFVVGVWRGYHGVDPKPDPAAPGAPGAPMRPLRWITSLYGRFLLLYLVAATVSLTYGYVGGTTPGELCVDASGLGGPLTGRNALAAAQLGTTARHGAELSVTTSAQACALHPGAVQWLLFLLTKVPEVAFWGCVLLLTLRLIRQASRTGPFTVEAAATMLILGWVVALGSMIVGALGALGADLLTRMLITFDPFDAGSIAVDVLVRAPLEALLPVPALVGAALVTFSHITRVGAAMDEEIKATV
jgi:hypothetical protein